MAEGEQEPQKETVILVHGTFAAPVEGKHQWHQPFEAGSSADAFASKLNSALERHGSPARCWAHCTSPKEQAFFWTGNNSWLDRAQAGSAISEHIASARKNGWACHVVAHSHGGNILMDALPSLMSAKQPQRNPASHVYMGTPFVDTTTPFVQQRARRRFVLNVLLWLMYVPIAAFFLHNYLGLGSEVRNFDSIADFVFLALVAAVLLLPPLIFWYSRRVERKTASRVEQAHPRILLMNSAFDEARQLLHHVAETPNPLDPKASFVSYVLQARRKQRASRAALSRMQGVRYFSDAGWPMKIIVTVLYLMAGAAVALALLAQSFAQTTQNPVGSMVLFFIAVFFFALVIFPLLLVTLLSAFLSRGSALSVLASPVRWIWERLLVTKNVATDIVTYVVRKQAWGVLQKMAYGLEGYPYKLPALGTTPANMAPGLYTYEDLPNDVADRAMKRRDQVVASHLPTVSAMLAKTTVTSADLSAFMAEVEGNVTLVHAAYYTDDACIDRIARWIAGKG